MKGLVGILHCIDAVSSWTGKIIGLGLYLLVGLLVFEVIARYVFDSPTIWANETALFLFGAFGALLGAHTLYLKGHVNLDLFYQRFSPRKKAVIDSITALLFFFFCGILLWKSWLFAYPSLMMREASLSIWHPPVYPVKLAMPVAVFLLIIQGLGKFTRDILFAISGEELR